MAGLALGLMAGVAASQAQTTWSGSTNSTWSTAGNWSSGVPSATNNAIFGVSSRTSPSVTAATTVKGITFNTSASAYTITGSTLSLGTGGIINNSANTQSIANAITLTGNQTWDSGTAGGTLSIGPGISATATAVALGSNTLTFTGSGTTLLNNVAITGAGNVVINGTGTVDYYGGANTYTGTTTVNSGTFVIDSYDGSQNGVLGNLIIGDGAGAADSALVRSGAETGPVANEVIKDTATVTINSDGKLDLNNQTETIAALVLTGGHVDSRSSGKLSIAGNLTTNASSQTAVIEGNLNFTGTSSTTRTIAVADGGAGSDLRIDALVSGSANLNKTGAGVLTLTNASNSFTGDTTISGGTIAVAADGALGVGGDLTLNGGTLEATSSFSTSRAVTLGASNGTVQTDLGASLTMSGVISGASRILNKTGDGTLTLSGTNTYTGGTIISGGTVAITANTNLGNASGGLTLNGGTLSTSGTIATSRTLTLNNVSGNTINTSSGTLTLNGSVSGSGDLTKTGSGTLTFGASASLGGDLTLSGGTISITNNSTLSIADTLHITANSTIDFSTGSSKLNVGTLLIDSGVTLTITGWNNGVDLFTAQNFTGASPDNRGGPGVSQVVFSGYSSSNTVWQGYDHQITPVPEPATYGLIMMSVLAGGVGLFGFLRRRNQRRALAA